MRTWNPMLFSRRVRLGCAAALGIVAVASPLRPAHALSITALGVTLGAGNSVDELVDTLTPPVTRVRTSTASVVSSSALAFQTRYALTVDADVGNSATIVESHTAAYTITFNVTQTAGVAWQLFVNTSRVGALTLVDDGNGSGSAALGAATGTKTGAGTLAGSLGVAAVTTLTGAAGGDTPFNQASSAVISGVGTGAAQAITLGFSFTASATSTRQGNNGDEAAVRMGLAGNATSFTAGNYPGVGARTLAGDGHFVSVSLVPEAASGTLLALGLAAFGMLGRQRPASR